MNIVNLTFSTIIIANNTTNDSKYVTKLDRTDDTAYRYLGTYIVFHIPDELTNDLIAVLDPLENS